MTRFLDHVRGFIIAIALAFGAGVAVATGTLNTQAFDVGSFINGIRIGNLLILPPATNAQLNSSVKCDDYPAVRCVVYNLTEDDVMTATSSTDWQSLQNGLAP